MAKNIYVDINDILALFSDGVTATEARDLVRRAYIFAEKAHRGQTRKSGEPYIIHPLAVAYFLAELHFEPAVIAAGLLHDVLEDCDVSRETLREQFGEEVLVLVEGVTKLEEVEERVKQDRERNRDLRELESLRKLLIAMVEDDIRIIFIKLADRLHNMRTLDSLPPKNQRRMAQETLDIFAPLANRLGIWVWKAELEDLSFRYLNPEMYSTLAKLLGARKAERHERVEQHIQQLRQALEKEGLPVTIKGRPKHIYSIYRKMQRKHVPFSHIYDTEGIRVIIEKDIPLELDVPFEQATPEAIEKARKEQQRKESALCYLVISVVHNMWTPVPGEFDDYIAHPKPNGYQSLHTAVVGEDGKPFEIQVRTRRMDRVAEYGVAAHWRYKEQSTPVDDQMMAQISQMRWSVHEITQESEDARAFIESIRSAFLPDRIFVFTPKGKIIDLPSGATPVDFAYHVHTEVGHRCRGARINGKWVSLDTKLQTGDQVEIITSKTGGPGRDWLDEESGFVVTHRARQKIRQWFRRQSREENAAQGKLMVERLLKRLNASYSLEQLLEIFKKRYQSLDDLFAAVALGDLTPEKLANRLDDYERLLHEAREKEARVEDMIDLKPPPPPDTAHKVTQGINIRGTGGLLTNLAKCCNPLPGDEIVGFVTRGRGVTIHKRECPNVLRIMTDEQERERLIEVDWGTPEEQTFAVQVRVDVYDRSGLFHDISTVLMNNNVNMTAIRSGNKDRYNIMPLYLTIEVPDLATLVKIMSKIDQIPNVMETRRIT